jgi:hypothetical protein
MKRFSIKKFNSISVTLILLASLFLGVGQAFAASGSLSLSPASANVSQGSTITINIYENSGADAVDSVQANLTYPANLLDFVSIASSSAFSVVAQSTGGGGGVQVARGALPAVTGSQLVASVRFKAKANSGSAVITFAAGSTIVSGGADIPTSTKGSTITLTPPAAAAPAPPADKTAPVISDIKVSEITNNTATVTWTTSEPATSGVDYGPTTAYGLAAADNSPVTAHRLVLNSAILKPGEIYHFVVKSVDPAGNATVAADQTLKTRGLDLTITVLDLKSKPISGATVRFEGKTVKTNSKGQATLKEVSVNGGTLIVVQGSKESSTSIEVTQAAANLAKPVTIKIKRLGGSPSLLIIFVIAIVVSAGFIYYQRRGRRINWSGPTGGDTPAAVIGGTDINPKTAGPAPKPPAPSVKAGAGTDSPMETVVVKPTETVDSDSEDN